MTVRADYAAASPGVTRAPSAVLSDTQPRWQSWNPRPGPTVVVRLPRGHRVLGVRIIPDGS